MSDTDVETNAATDEDAVVAVTDAENGEEDAPKGESLLVREGDIAADYLERLLDIVDYDGDIDLDVENDRAVVAIVGSDLHALVGGRGETLDALQELTRLAVQQQTGIRSRLMLDVSGHRQARRTELQQLASRHGRAGPRERRAGPVVTDESVRAQGRARRDRRDRRRAQRIRGRGAVAAGSRTRRTVTPADVGSPAAAPAAPASAVGVFAGRLELAIRFADRLASVGVERGLIGPREVDRLWERHLLNSAVVTELVPDGCRIVDVGSGAGLPGLPMAIRRADLRVDLVEPMLRRTQFLTETVAELDLVDRVRVIRGRAEEPAIRLEAGNADWVVARAVAPLDRLVKWCLPLLAPGGRLLALKGRTAEDEVAEHRIGYPRTGGFGDRGAASWPVRT